MAGIKQYLEIHSAALGLRNKKNEIIAYCDINCFWFIFDSMPGNQPLWADNGINW